MWDLPDQNGSPPPVAPTEWMRLMKPEPAAAGGLSDEDEELLGQGKLRGAESVVRRLLQVRPKRPAASQRARLPAKEPCYQQKSLSGRPTASKRAVLKSPADG